MKNLTTIAAALILFVSFTANAKNNNLKTEKPIGHITEFENSIMKTEKPIGH